MTQFSEHFTEAELACPTTGAIKLADGFIEKLECLRIAYDLGMSLTSGCRSKEHNELLIRDGQPAHPTSLHMIGNPRWKIDCCAVDVRRPAGDDLARLIRIALASDWSVGLAPVFVHLDLRAIYTTKPQWFYSY